MRERQSQSATAQGDFSNKAVLVMLLIVIVISLASLVIYLNALDKVVQEANKVSTSAPIAAQPVSQGSLNVQGFVGLTILPHKNTMGGNP